MRPLALFVLLAAGCDEPPTPAQPARSEFLRRIDARPLPDLETLPARARDRVEGSFEDILKLREAGGPEAVPALVAILRAYRGKTHIHGHAAAQALFRIGGDEAHAAVREAFQADESWWRSAADYAFHWDMAAPDRDRFLEEHVLKSTRTTLEARLAADRATVRAGEALTLTLTLKNTGTAPASIWTYGDVIEADLFLRRPDGRFVGLRRLRTTCLEPQHRWVVLEPGVAQEFRFERSFAPRKPRSDDVGADLAVESEDGRGGRFEVIAVFARAGVPRLPPEPPATPWSGRVVCEPLALTIAE